jgi:hypothetical protein
MKIFLNNNNLNLTNSEPTSERVVIKSTSKVALASARDLLYHIVFMKKRVSKIQETWKI